MRRCEDFKPPCQANLLVQLIHGKSDTLFHSDRGTQYTCKVVGPRLKDHGLTASMGAVGTCADNASAEGFFGQLKRELRKICRNDTRKQATVRINDYIVGLYNVIRRLANAEAAVRDVILEAEGRSVNALIQENRKHNSVYKKCHIPVG